MFAAAVMVAAASAAGRRTGALPRDVVVAGFDIAALLLGVMWVPQFLVPVWVFAVSVAGLRRSPASEEAAARREPART